MTKDEALRLALKALRFARDDGYENEVSQEAITAIKAALEAKDEPEYYGLTKDHLWMSISKEHYDRLKPEFRMACYTTPPQRKPLTDEQAMDAYFETPPFGTYKEAFIAGIRFIEAAHGIKEEA